MATMLVQNQWVLLSEQYLGNSGGNLYVRLWAKLWGSEIENNRSYVYIEAWAYYTGSWIKDNQGSGYVTDGSKRSDGSCTYLTNGETKIAGIEGWYTHNNDGTLDLWAEAHLKFPNWGWSGTTSAWCTLPKIARKAEITSAPNFTDEDSPTIHFTNPAGNAVTTKVCISWTGADDIPYRNIVKPTDTSYTFKFTEAELNALYDATIASNSNTIDVKFYVTTIIGSNTYYSTLVRKFTVVNCNPILDPEVLDYGDVSFNVTNDRDILLRYFNYPKATFNATAVKRASIVSKTVTCGTQTLIGSGDYAQFNNVDSNEFVFTVVDNRGNKASKTITKEMIDYVIPTCRLSTDTDLTGDNIAGINLTITGKYYEGSLGAIDNTLTVEYRYRTTTETFADDDWISVSAAVSGTDYTATSVIDNVHYKNTYVIQARVKDTIYTWGVSSTEEIVRVVPVFDWGENDFNFNVPVYKEGNPMGYYPVGGIYTSTDGTNPGDLFGGTWELMRTFYGGELVAYGTTYNPNEASTSFNSSNTEDYGISDIFIGDNTSNIICNYVDGILTANSGTIWVQTKGVVGLVEAYIEISGAAQNYCYGIWFKMTNKNTLPESVTISGGGSLQGLGHDPTREGTGQSHPSYTGTSSRYFYNIADNDTGSDFFVNPQWKPYGSGSFIAGSSGTKCVLQVKAYAKGGTTYMWRRTA